MGYSCNIILWVGGIYCAELNSQTALHGLVCNYYPHQSTWIGFRAASGAIQWAYCFLVSYVVKLLVVNGS